ncbi:MAG: glycosyltransferase family 4 protein [bacterium]|nr:glycosyltransferase family 4 protein [bacterium]
MKKVSVKKPKIGFISTYIPRECGIGTFTNDIVKNISKLHKINEQENPNTLVVAISDKDNFYSYPAEVKFEINQQNRKNYINAAHFLNNSDIDIVNIQHEFGIFGGYDGNFILDTVNKLRKPIVTTFHTVLENPSIGQKTVIEELSSNSVYVVVLARRAINILKNIYKIPEKKIVFIEHGAPNVSFMDSSYYKSDFNASGRKIILTFGLINPNKGIEYGIKAISKIAKKHPNILYIILGTTHPEVKKQFGEEYRMSLELLVKKYGIEENVEFFNYFVTKKELIKFLIASDIYLTPYLSKEQIVSGTLAYALTCGKALVSTPYWYAEELLAEERGILVPFKDEDAIADAVNALLENEKNFSQYRKNAYDYGREFVWDSVADKFEKVFTRAIENYSDTMKKSSAIKRTILPEINLNHFKIMTDDTGIFQHCTMNIPNREFGYTTDDNARALIVAVKNWNMSKSDENIEYITRYLSFLLYAYDDNAEGVRNFMNYQRIWTDTKISEDTAGRMVWALGYCLKHAPNNAIHIISINLFKKIISNVTHFTSPRAWSFVVIGSVFYLSIYPGDLEVKNISTVLIKRMLDQLNNNKDKDWMWLEDILSYENARIPQAFFSYGGFFDEKKILLSAKNTFRWIMDIQTDKVNNRLSLIGNKGWMKRDKVKAKFDQQPVEIAAIIDAAYEGYKYTKDPYYEEVIELGIDWFLGNNDVGGNVYDFNSGGSRDGIHSLGVNLNEGAESTLSWLLSLHRLYDLHQLKIKSGEKYSENKS